MTREREQRPEAKLQRTKRFFSACQHDRRQGSSLALCLVSSTHEERAFLRVAGFLCHCCDLWSEFARTARTVADAKNPNIVADYGEEDAINAPEFSIQQNSSLAPQYFGIRVRHGAPGRGLTQAFYGDV